MKGIIKAVSQKEGKYGVNINDEWVNGFGDCPVEKGDEVEISYEENESNGKTYKNVTEIKATVIKATSEIKLEAAKPSEIKPNDFFERDKRIQKMNTLNNAVKLIEIIGVPENTTKEEVLKLVKELSEDLIKLL